MAKRDLEPSAQDTRTQLDAFEDALEALRISYEKYFSGVDRMPPVRERASVERDFHRLEALSVRATGMRFRISGLRARFVTYKHYWTRVLGEMERGVSRRDLQKRHAGARSGAPPPSSPRPPAKPGDRLGALGLDPDNLREVYDQLVRAREAHGQSNRGLTYEALQAKLELQAEELRDQREGRRLRFEVAVDGGNVRVRAKVVAEDRNNND